MKTGKITAKNSVEFSSSSTNINKIDGYLTFTDGYNPAGVTLSDLTAADAYINDFTNSDLVAGNLTVTHSLNNKYVIVDIYNGSDKKIIPDDITLYTDGYCTVNLSSFGAITGTWHVIVSVGAIATTAASAPIVEFFSGPTLASQGAITVGKFSDGNSWTVGIQFAVSNSANGIITGVRFYCGGGIGYPKTFSFKLWDPIGSLLKTVSQTISSNGLYEILFSSPYVVPNSDRMKSFKVSYFDTTTAPGTIEYPNAATSVWTYRPALPFFKSEYVLLINDNLYAAGDNYPNSISSTERYLIEPIVT